MEGVGPQSKIKLTHSCDTNPRWQPRCLRLIPGDGVLTLQALISTPETTESDANKVTPHTSPNRAGRKEGDLDHLGLKKPMSWMQVRIQVSKPANCAPPWVNPHIRQTWVTVTCPVGWGMVTNTPSGGGVGSGGQCWGWESGDLPEISAPSSQFWCEPKTSLE